ncbi:MAG: DMT family transporter [Paracoccaceae bacterium]|nr:DMT family transporter [Paracoccaceae bacterium]
MGNARGAALMTLSMAGFAIEDMFIKLMGGRLPIGQILVCVGAGGGLAVALWALWRGERPLTRAMFTGASGLRAILEGLVSIGIVAALTMVPISVVTTIIQANPLLVTLGAALFFGEPVGWRRWSAIAVGLAGVLIVLRPFGAEFQMATLFALAAVLAQAARDLVTRRVTGTISTVQLATLGFAAVVPAGLLTLAATGEAIQMPDLRTTGYLAGAIAAAIPSLYAIIAAMRIGDISFVAPFRYSRIVFGLGIGALVFGEALDGWMLTGAAIITASGLYTFAREARARRRPSPAPGTAI